MTTPRRLRIYIEMPLTPRERSAVDALVRDDEAWFAEPGRPPTPADVAAFAQAEVAFGAVQRALLPQGKALRWLQFPSVGVDYYRDFDWSTLAGRVTCTNLRGVFNEAVAQTVLGGILALYRGIDTLARAQEKRAWCKMEVRPRARVLRGERVLMLGGGELASRVRAALAPFGCTFQTFARTGGDVRTPEELDAALAEADIVCGALPDTPLTRNLLDLRRLKLLKPTAVLVNVGRGTLIDEAALAEVLRAGGFAGAVIDVTHQEPLPPESPLWTSPNILLTQHTSAGSSHEILDTIACFGENLARYRAGEPVKNVVEWGRGY